MAQLISLLKTFAWLRWKIYLNGARANIRRGMLGRFAAVSQTLVYGFMIVSLGFTTLILTAAAAVLGWSIGSETLPTDDALMLLRIAGIFFVLAGCAMPLVYGGRGSLPSPSRLLLLPIESGWLHLMHYLGGLFDPLLLMGIATLVLFPVGIAVGGQVVTAAVALAAGVGLVLLVAALGAWGYTLVIFALRHRLAQGLGLAGILTILGLSALPMMFEDVTVPALVLEGLWLVNVPGELYATAVFAALENRMTMALAAALGLVLVAALVYRLSDIAYQRLLASGDDAGSQGKASSRGGRHEVTLPLPGLPVDVAAVASLQLRLARRTLTGKLAALQPVLMVGLFGFTLVRAEDNLPVFLAPALPLLLLLFATSMSVLSPMNLQFNQFAIDTSGATQLVLLPLRAETVVYGKAVAFFLLSAFSLAPAALVAVLLTRPGVFEAITGIVTVYLVLLSSHFLLAPIAVVLSAVVPRTVNLNKAFSESQPHSFAVLTSLFAGPAVFSLAGLMALAGLLFSDSHLGACLLVLLWSVVAFLLGRVLLPVAAQAYERRREAVLMAAQGR